VRRIGVLLVCLLAAAIPLSGAEAQTVSDTALDQIAAELAGDGRSLDFPPTTEDTRAIDGANDRGIAFAWLDTGEDAQALAVDLSDRLEQRSSRYPTVLVLTNTSVGASSLTVGGDDIDRAFDASETDFASFAVADAVDAFVDALAGGEAAGSTPPPSGGGTGLWIVLVAVVVIGGCVWGLLVLRTRSRARKRAAAELEADRDEIKAQLLDNADKVLTLGDRVIASGDRELIDAYEQASAAYQDVSHSIGGASTAEAIDALDDKIDQAEWQLRSIEAKLEGRPPPPSPAELEARQQAARAQAAPAPAGDGPALGPDESLFPADRSGSPPRYRPSPPMRRPGTGGLGGILGGIVLGGTLGGGYRSRRSQRRYGATGSLGGGVLGGGVLGGGRRSGRSSGGRSFRPRSRSSGGRRF
jgi:hypothetical protein